MHRLGPASALLSKGWIKFIPVAHPQRSKRAAMQGHQADGWYQSSKQWREQEVIWNGYKYGPQKHFKNLNPPLKLWLREMWAAADEQTFLVQCQLRVSGLQWNLTIHQLQPEPMGEVDTRVSGTMLARFMRDTIIYHLTGWERRFMSEGTERLKTESTH